VQEAEGDAEKEELRELAEGTLVAVMEIRGDWAMVEPSSELPRGGLVRVRGNADVLRLQPPPGLQHHTTANAVAFGLDNSGTTTLVGMLKDGKAPSTIPTIGFSVEEIKHKNATIAFWELGGTEACRKHWPNYCKDKDLLFYVVDVQDRERFGLARQLLHDIVLSSEGLKGVPLMVLANKQDLPGALDAAATVAELGLDAVHDRPWQVLPSCLVTGYGLWESFDWSFSFLALKARQCAIS